jgi:hypothetical protein
MDLATVKAIFWLAMAAAVLIALPLSIIISVRQLARGKKLSGEKGTRSGAGIGNALQEFDRLVARPAVEYTIEAETPILKREDDRSDS